MTPAVVAPTDPQLAYIAELARRNGLRPEDIAVGSFADASRCIDALKDGSFDPDEWAYDRALGWVAGVPFV